MRKLTEESLDVSRLRNIEERCRLEGAIGYITYLLEELHKGKLKTVVDITSKLSLDAETTSSALAYHFKDKLKTAGWASGLFVETTKKEAEKHG
jgi:hypothetical protein